MNETIIFVRGDTFVLPFTWLSLDASPVSLDDITLTARLSWKRGEILAAVSVGDEQGTGLIRIEEDHPDNEKVPLGSLSWLTIAAEYPNGDRQTIARVSVEGALGPDGFVSASGSDPETISVTAIEQALRIHCDPIVVGPDVATDEDDDFAAWSVAA